MGTTLLAIMLGALNFVLTRQWQMPDAPTFGVYHRLSRVPNWQRQTLILLASSAVSFLISREILVLWFSTATKISAVLGIGPGQLTLVLLGAFAMIAAVLRFRSAIPIEVAFTAPSLAAQSPAEPNVTKMPRSKATKGVVFALLAAVLLLAGFLLHPAFFQGTDKGKLSTPPSGKSSDAIAESTPVAATAPKAASNVERDWAVLDKALDDLVDATLAARVASRDIATHLADRLARDRKNGNASGVEQLNGIIAERESDVQSAREKTRTALTEIAAEIAADSNVRPPFMTATDRLLVQNNPPVQAFLWQIYRIEFPPSAPDDFVTKALAAWETVIAFEQVAAASRERPSDELRFSNPGRNRQPFSEPVQRSLSPSESQRYSRESGNARSRQQERHKRAPSLPPEEFQ